MAPDLKAQGIQYYNQWPTQDTGGQGEDYPLTGTPEGFSKETP